MSAPVDQRYEASASRGVPVHAPAFALTHNEVAKLRFPWW